MYGGFAEIQATVHGLDNFQFRVFAFYCLRLWLFQHRVFLLIPLHLHGFRVFQLRLVFRFDIYNAISLLY